MIYAITHLTSFTYSEPISDSVMEVRMQPRTDDHQRCMRFELKISPKSRSAPLYDYLGNVIHLFDIPGSHKKLAVRAESLVETRTPAPLPDALSPDDWTAIDRATREERDLHDMTLPSTFARPTPALDAFGQRIDAVASAVRKHGPDPLTTLLAINHAIYTGFDYTPNVTRVDSPIDDALLAGQGVCQDFAHIMTALVRGLGIPCRYVSGYLFYRANDPTRADDATHAWVEAWLPGLGWVGLDPTNDLICGDRHIRAALGRDYADVPPTKGVFRGDAYSTLEVSVKISCLENLPNDDHPLAPEISLPQYETLHQMQMHQQQQ